jgi:glycosyltransferase involved in cell wall biosynthesis
MTLSVIHFVNLRETPTFAPFSGAENHLWVLLPALRAAGVRVELGILLQAMGPRIQAKITELRAQDIEVQCFPYHHPFDPLCLAFLYRHLSARRNDVVHTHLDPSDVYGKTAARLAGCTRIVSTVHNNEPGHLRLRWFYLLRLMDRLTTHHIAISDVVRRHLIQLERVAPEKVTVIPYGVPAPATIGDRAELRTQLGLPPDRFVIGFVGRLVEQKNVSLLIEAMKHLPDALCAIVGSGALRDQLERQAAGLSNVRFLDHQPRAEDLMPAFDVLCLPSRWEGLGLVLVEAMLRGVLVIGSRAGAIPEVLGEGQYGVLFDPDDVNGLVAAINTVRASAASFAERARQYARQTYAVDKMVARTLGVYDQITRMA